MTYYRLHRPDAPEFSADNARSGVWGTTFSPDGSRQECPVCDGAGKDAFGQPCDNGCDEGWFDADRGYSCCYTAEELVDYFRRHAGADEGLPVVIFDGQQVGSGCDGEPLVVPTSVIRWTTFGDLA